MDWHDGQSANIQTNIHSKQISLWIYDEIKSVAFLEQMHVIHNLLRVLIQYGSTATSCVIAQSMW